MKYLAVTVLALFALLAAAAGFRRLVLYGLIIVIATIVLWNNVEMRSGSARHALPASTTPSGR